MREKERQQTRTRTHRERASTLCLDGRLLLLPQDFLSIPFRLQEAVRESERAESLHVKEENVLREEIEEMRREMERLKYELFMSSR